jgi:hypothetical protein
MTATEFQAMLYARKVGGIGERELKKHISSHLGPGLLSNKTKHEHALWGPQHCSLQKL